MPFETTLFIRNINAAIAGQNPSEHFKTPTTIQELKTQMDLIPERVPFSFMLGRLCVLSQSDEKGLKWLTMDLPANLGTPDGYQMGKIYTKDANGQKFVRTSEGVGGEWLWARDETVQKDYQNFFNANTTDCDAANNSFNANGGFAVCTPKKDREIIPVGTLKLMALSKNSTLVYDPLRTTTQAVDQSAPTYISEQMKQSGWFCATKEDGNKIFIRTTDKPPSP